MAATLDLMVSEMLRAELDANDLHDFAWYHFGSVARREPLLCDAIRDRGTHYKPDPIDLSREQASCIERKAQAFKERGSFGKQRYGEQRGPRTGRPLGTVCEGWFVDPSGQTVQGHWMMRHDFGKFAALDVELYRDGDSRLGRKALS